MNAQAHATGGLLAVTGLLSGEVNIIPLEGREGKTFNRLGGSIGFPTLRWQRVASPKSDASSEAAFAEALALGESLVRESPKVPNYRGRLAISYRYLGEVAKEKGQFPEAEKAYRQAQDILVKLAAEFPTFSGYQYELARVEVLLGRLWQKRAAARKRSKPTGGPLTSQRRSSPLSRHWARIGGSLMRPPGSS
jgi:hypothetical protein